MMQDPRPSSIDLETLVRAYHEVRPDPSDPAQRIVFGTSGHRGSALRGSFNEAHVRALGEAVIRYRQRSGIGGPLFLGRDTHALSRPAFETTVEVLLAGGVAVMVDAADGYTPTPAVSHAILTHNRGHRKDLADGIVLTPSHNPPEDGGFKYNPPSGGPADTEITAWIEGEANRLLAAGATAVRSGMARARPQRYDYLGAYVNGLGEVVEMEAIRKGGLRLGADPLGGASLAYWEAVAERWGLDLQVVNRAVDPTFGFVPPDWDGKVRMDCSSPWAMAGLIQLAERFDIAFANDPDADRHGIVTRGAGLLDPNHFLAVAVWYLFRHRPGWPPKAAVGKTLVTSSLLDRVAAELGRKVFEVPVGFKWFVPGLLEGWLGFGGEESAGASFLSRNGRPWSTDKDGIIMALLAAELTAKSGRDPGELYLDLAGRLGAPAYRRLDAPATPAQKEVLWRLSPEQIRVEELGGEPVRRVLTAAPGNGAPIGGIKVITDSSWFAARPSGTEDIYKIYAESFRGEEHLQRIIEEATALVTATLAAAGRAAS